MGSPGDGSGSVAVVALTMPADVTGAKPSVMGITTAARVPRSTVVP